MLGDAGPRAVQLFLSQVGRCLFLPRPRALRACRLLHQSSGHLGRSGDQSRSWCLQIYIFWHRGSAGRQAPPGKRTQYLPESVQRRSGNSIPACGSRSWGLAAVLQPRRSRPPGNVRSNSLENLPESLQRRSGSRSCGAQQCRSHAAALPALPHYFYIFACLLGVLESSLLLVDRAWLLDVG